jgi:DNA-directed RNA polymerase subunit RPC12/RpoP
MHSNTKHVMQLVKTHAAGEEEWACPQCGRRLLIAWQSQPPSQVLESGDRFALHSCIKGPLQFDGVEVEDAPTAELRRGPWGAWLDEVDFDSES